MCSTVDNIAPLGTREHIAHLRELFVYAASRGMLDIGGVEVTRDDFRTVAIESHDIVTEACEEAPARSDNIPTDLTKEADD